MQKKKALYMIFCILSKEQIVVLPNHNITVCI